MRLKKPRLYQITDLTTGVVVEERYHLGPVKGGLHRDPSDGPALIFRNETSGKVTREIYSVRGRYHREDGPAVIWWDADTGRVIEESYYVNGKCHRVGGPASVEWDGKTGAVVTTDYYQNGERHRRAEEGPARIRRDPQTGEITQAEYWENGRQVAPPRGRTSPQRKPGEAPDPS